MKTLTYAITGISLAMFFAISFYHMMAVGMGLLANIVAGAIFFSILYTEYRARMYVKGLVEKKETKA